MIIAAVALVLVGLGIGVPLSKSLGGGFSTGPSRPDAYQIVYRQDITTSGDTVRWEDLRVRRPFEAADLLYDSPPTAGAQPLSGTISTEDGLFDVRQGNSLLLVGGRQPGVPSGDQDLITQLPDMESRGLASDLGVSQVVAGRSCHVYRFFEPPSGPVKPLSDAADHDDICIDGDGLVLGEAWTLKGKLVLTRRALRVSLSAPPLPSTNGASHPTPGSGTPIATVTSSPSSFLSTPAPPPGFAARPPVQMLIPSPQDPQALMAETVVWAFSDGPATVSVEAGREPPGQLPWQTGDTVTRPVQLAGLGAGTTALRSDGAEIRVDLGNGEWVRIHGTVPVAALVDYANSLKL